MKIGITGEQGFVGTHLKNYLHLFDDAKLIPFQRNWFESNDTLDLFVSQCDAIVHLAAVNRHEDQQVLHDTNVALAQKLVDACKRTESIPHLLISSSTQEEKDNVYGQSKKTARLIFENWAKETNGLATGLIIPNVFGPFGKPYYNSVVATFCHKITRGETPEIHVDGTVNLIYVLDLVEHIRSVVFNPDQISRDKGAACWKISHTKSIKVSALLAMLNDFKTQYMEGLTFPDLSDDFTKALFNTFRCYVPEEFYPQPHKLNIDERGMFVEYARTQTSGQSSFSTTVPGITRGNHYHATKAERFTVIKGKALIQLRKIGTDEVINYELDGSKPSFVDMPIWYTHNITNIGEEELVTLFWINEPYDPENPDTYWETV